LEAYNPYQGISAPSVRFMGGGAFDSARALPRCDRGFAELAVGIRAAFRIGVDEWVRPEA
jgi:hypothetical protein